MIDRKNDEVDRQRRKARLRLGQKLYKQCMVTSLSLSSLTVKRKQVRVENMLVSKECGRTMSGNPDKNLPHGTIFLLVIHKVKRFWTCGKQRRVHTTVNISTAQIALTF